jgi:hypothetical protein
VFGFVGACGVVLSINKSSLFKKSAKALERRKLAAGV